MLGNQAPQSLALGQLGSSFFNDTGAHTGSWGIIYALSDATFTTLTAGKLADGKTACMSGTLSSITLKAGQSLYGLFTAITLAGGSVIAYNA